MSSNASYSKIHRSVEISAIALYVALLIFVVFRASWSPWVIGPEGWAWAVAAVVAGLIAADFVSGLVHWLADSFCSVEMPLIGPAYLRPFREHHVFPEAMTEHDVIETNGNNCVCILLFLPFVLHAQRMMCPTCGAWLELAVVAFTIGIFVTNQVHSWAHEKRPSAFVAFLQRHRIILNPDDHALHHAPPHKSYYCITFGWVNPLLERIRFFPVMTAIFSTFMPPADEPFGTIAADTSLDPNPSA